MRSSPPRSPSQPPSRPSCRIAWCRCLWIARWAPTTSTRAWWKMPLAPARAPSSCRTRWAIPATWKSSAKWRGGAGLWLLEDGCDALGATFNGQLAGTFGEMASLSFYPLITSPWERAGALPSTLRPAEDCPLGPRLGPRLLVRSQASPNTCGSASEWQTGELPCGYDHKYIYSNIGYNLKVTDLQAAIGLAQTEKLDAFIAARRGNFQHLYQGLLAHGDYLILPRKSTRAPTHPLRFPHHRPARCGPRPPGPPSGGRAD
jgi:hypothetical protein